MATPWIRSPRLVIIAVVATVGAFLLLHRLTILEPVESLAARAWRPIAETVAGWGGRWNEQAIGFRTNQELRVENDRLREEIAQFLLNAEANISDAIEARQVAEARTVLGERRWSGTLARVIGRSADPTFRLYLLNRGRNQGIQPGAAVMIGNGLYIGQILEAEPETSKMVVMTDSHASIAAMVENEQRSQGIVTGEVGLSLTMDLLLKTETIAVGQPVVTSGVEGDVPPGLVIGRVTEVENFPGELFQRAVVTPAADLRNLTVVTVINFRNA